MSGPQSCGRATKRSFRDGRRRGCAAGRAPGPLTQNSPGVADLGSSPFTRPILQGVPVQVSQTIEAPIERVFAFFDDPANTVAVSPHAQRFEVIAVTADGRRTYDIWIRSVDKEWMQTVEQVLREPGSRLVTRGWSWTNDRSKAALRITTDRQFSEAGRGTRVFATIDAHVDQPLRHPVPWLRNTLARGYAQAEFEHQLAVIAKRIEAQEADTGP